MKAAVYVRVSSEEQVDGYSLDAQVRAAKAYCEKEQWDATFFEEAGASGTSTEKRPVFRDMIARCKAHQFDVVLVHKLDRFARSREDSVIYKSLLKREGIRVISVTEQFDDGPMGQLVEGFMECIAQWYSANLSTEVKKGLAERALAGKHHAKVPIGYRLFEGKAVPDETLGPVIRQAFHDYSSGTKSLRDVRFFMLDAVGRKYSCNGMLQILRNPFYAGRMVHHDEIVPAIHEALVSESVFQAVQETLSANGHAGGAAKGLHAYELSTMLLCDCGCGRHMAGQSCTSKYGKQYFRYYHVQSIFTPKYHGYTINAIEADAMVSKLLTKRVRSDWQYRIAEVIQKRMPPAAISDNTAEKLARAKELYIAGDVTRDEYLSLKSRLDVKPQIAIPVVNMPALLSIINMPATAWTQAEPRERWRRNKLLLEWVKIKDGKITGYELTELAKTVFEE